MQNIAFVLIYTKKNHKQWVHIILPPSFWERENKESLGFTLVYVQIKTNFNLSTLEPFHYMVISMPLEMSWCNGCEMKTSPPAPPTRFLFISRH